MTKVVNFTVGMTCGGCSGAVTKILSKIEGTLEVMRINRTIRRIYLILIVDFMICVGVTNVDANVETKNVAVTCAADVADDVLLNALQKWSSASGKSVSLVTA